MRNTILILGFTLLLLSGGCTMIPKYQRPESPVPRVIPGTEASTAIPVNELTWKEFFVDPGLQAIIELALENNRDLKIATLNVEKLRSVYRIQRASLFPGLSSSAGADNYRVPEQMSSSGAYNVAQYSIRGSVSWEIDLFGRIRSLKKKALNQFLAMNQTRNAARISLISAVADSYLALAADLEILELARSTLKIQETSFDLIRQSRDAGVASDLTFYQSRSQVEAARLDVARSTGLVSLDRNSLNLLVGSIVNDKLLPTNLSAVEESPDVSPGLESIVLLRRPDIQAAEYQLKSMNANIGAARAAFFPRISLTAAIGTVAPDLATLFETGTDSWAFTPQIIQPIFAGGSLFANLKSAKIDRDIAVAQYEKAIQTAFREISDVLAKQKTLSEQLDAQQALVKSLDESFRLSNARYNEGIDSYLGVLVSQRSLYDAQRGLIGTRQACRSLQIAMFKVLGGTN